MENKLEQIIQQIQEDDRTSVSIELTVTNECNCNCEYCFECSHDDISNRDEELRQLNLLRNYCLNFDRLKHRNLKIVFWGGEPMMNTRFLFELIRATYEFDFVSYLMYSNGTLKNKFDEFLKQDFIDSIRDRIEIQLSYDGEPHHKLKRGTDSSVIFRVADELIERGFDVSFKATLSMDSLNLLPQIWDSYEELWQKYPFVYYSPTIDQTNGNNSDENFEIWKKVLVDIARRERVFIAEHKRPLWSWFTNPGKLACSPNNIVHIHCDGNMYVCHGCQYQERSKYFITGNTKQIDDLEKSLNKGFRPTLRDIRCVECSAVECSVCHVCELAKTDETAINHKELWTKIMVNNQDRCRFFQYFGKIYHAIRLANIETIWN